MNKAGKIFAFVTAVAAILACGCTKSGKTDKDNLRLVYWNIQNGMWDGQDDDFARFTSWVEARNPDVCVWCEAQPIYKSGTADQLDDIESWRTDERLLSFWQDMAARYGHKYVFLGGHRDNYPQVITSKYPIKEVARITGTEEVIVSHGAGWAQIEKNGNTLNIVTLHTWPHGYAYKATDREKSIAEHGGDYFRKAEMQYICEHTIGSVEGASDQMWMMMGDFNSRSRVDQDIYKYEEPTTLYMVHDYIRENTPYLDVIHELYPDKFYTTTGGQARIDYVYCTKPLFDRIKTARVYTDAYTAPVRDAKKISNFWHPSDHRPIVVDFDMHK